MDNEHSRSSIYTFDGDLLPISEILRIEESFVDTYIIMVDGKKYKSALTIDELEWDLPKDKFTRVHSKHLINTAFKVHQFSINMDCVQLSNGENIPISKSLMEEGATSKKSTFKEQLIQLLFGRK